MAERALHPIRRDHLEALTGPLGIWQHADGNRPNEAFGYCTDDVARALAVDLAHGFELGWPAVQASAWRSLRFLEAAFDESSGRFRNFRSADGLWLVTDSFEDCDGRALRALGQALARSPEPAFAKAARTLFLRGLNATRKMRSLRAQASAALGCVAALEAGDSSQVRTALGYLGTRLKRAFMAHSTDEEWPWPDETLTYENGLLPEALIGAGAALGDPVLTRLGLSAFDWLEQVQSAPAGFLPIGNAGWWKRHGARAVFDQQPIEAASMVLAAAAAFDRTREERYLPSVDRAYAWFLGDNSLGMAVADPATGGCHDGLTPKGLNLNQGAESTLMWQIALEAVRATRRTAARSRTSPMRAPMPGMAGSRS